MSSEVINIEIDLKRAKAKRAADTLDRLDQGAKRLRKDSKALGKDLGQDLGKGADKATKGVKRLGSSIKTMGRNAGSAIGGAVKRLREYRKAQRAANAETSRGAKLARGLGKGGLLLGGAVAGGALAAGAAAFATVQQTREAMDEAAKNGFLAVDAFGRLKHAAGLSGAEIGDVIKGGQNLQTKLTKPTIEFTHALDDLGLTAEDLKKLDPEAQLEAIADGMAKLPNDTARSAAAFNVLGESGRKLVPLLKNDGQAIRDMGKDAEALGRVFDATAAGAAERFGDAQDRLRMAFSGLGAQLAAEYMPALAEAGEGAVAWIMANREAILAWIRDVVDRLVEAGRAAAEWFASVDWEQVWTSLSEIGSAVLGVVEGVGTMIEVIGGAETAFLAMGLAASTSLGPIGMIASAGIAAGYALGSAMHRAKNAIMGVNMELGQMASRARDIQAIAGLQAAFAEEDAKDEAAEAAARAGATPPADAVPPPGQSGADFRKQRIAQLKRDARSKDPATRTAAQEALKREGIKAGGGGKGAKPSTAFGSAVDSAIAAEAEKAAFDAAARARAQGASVKEQRKAAAKASKDTIKALQGDQRFADKALEAEGAARQKAAFEGRATGAFGAVGGAEAVRLDVGAGTGGAPPMIVNTTKVDIAKGAVMVTGNEFAADLPTLGAALDTLIVDRLAGEVAAAMPIARGTTLA